MTTNPLVPVERVEEPPVKLAGPRTRPSAEEIASWIVMAVLLLFAFRTHLIPALIIGLVFYLTLDRLALWFSRHVHDDAARPLALLLVTLAGIGIVFGGIALSISFLRHHVDRVPAMMTEMANILQSTRAYLGGYGQQLIPEVMTDAETIKGAIALWLKEHASALKLAGGSFSVALLRAIMGMLLAILVFFRHVTHHEEHMRGAFARSMAQKVHRFADAFSRIAIAQFKISGLNTLITAAYLVSLPLFGKQMPFVTTLIVLTFICGFVPILGNLVSNSVIVILSLGISPGTAIASLIFLIVVHKLQYLLNSRIVGSQIDSQAWEVLLAIILGEAAFGVAGVVMAPIVYAFAKGELRDRGLV